MQPLFEFSGACSGCGETPYIKLLTQLIGDHLMIANATGCSSIFGGNLPTTPYTTNDQGRGPAWANSLFENNAEFALGMRMAEDQLQERAKLSLQQLQVSTNSSQIKELVAAILNPSDNSAAIIAEQRTKISHLKPLLEKIPGQQELLEIIEHIIEKSVWAIGGDGWAYDIGYGGLDHVIASGRKVKMLILDTESYSNTGGQMSKATPLGAAAKYATTGKPLVKKDLGQLAMTYQNVYVAQISLSANPMQAIRAINEAENYDGPAIVIAFAQCIAHGVEMANSAEIQRKAVQSGYWLLYRYNPTLSRTGKNPLQLDSHAPQIPLSDFYTLQNRFKSIATQDANHAAELLEVAQNNIIQRYQRFEYLSQQHL